MAFNQKQLEEARVYQSESPLADLLNDLNQILALADAFRAKQKKQAKTGGWCMLGGLIAALVGIAFPPLLVIGILVMIFGLFWWIGSFFKGSKILEHSRRIDVAKDCLTVLQDDAGAKSKFTLRLNLASNPTQLKKEDWSGRKSGKQEFLEESWLMLSGSLMDGTAVAEEIKELTRKRSFRNPRGKSKTKTRTTQLVNVRLNYPKERYGDARPAEAALRGKLKVGEHATLRTVRASEKAILLRAMVSAGSEISKTVGMLALSGYRILNLARRIAGGQQGESK